MSRAQTAQEAIQAGLDALGRDDLPQAVQAFQHALAMLPGNIGLLRSIATLHSRLGDYAALNSLCIAGLQTAPQDAVLRDHWLEARARLTPGDTALLAEAEAWAAAAPREPRAQYRLGDILLRAGRAAAALAPFTRAIELIQDAQMLPAYLTDGAEAAYQAGDIARARAWLDRAIALAPQNRSARLARATILLSLGEWDQGLEDYEARLLPSDTQRIQRDLMLPRWQGEPLAGRRLLVCAEQGIGDQIRFARQLPMLQNLTGGLIVECALRLVPLLERSMPGLAVHAAQEERIGNRHVFRYDWLPATDLPACYIEFGSIALRLLQQGIPPESLN